MPTDDTPTTERPESAQNQQKPAISDPRDDVREQVAMYRRDLQAYFARRTAYAPRRTTRRITH